MSPDRTLSPLFHCVLRLVVTGSVLLAPAARGAHEWFLDDPPLLSLGAGIAGVLDTEQEFGVAIEYRPAFRFYHFGPWFQVARGTEQEAYASLGVLINLHLGHNWILTPSFGAGYYNDRTGLNLGFDTEFRSSLELSKRFANRQQLGLSFGHLSNGSLSSINPGTEILMLIYSFPLDIFFRNPGGGLAE